MTERESRAPAGRSLEPAPRGPDARGLRLRRGRRCRTSSRAFNLSQLAAGVAEKALLVLPMVLLIIAREIDLSVACILALTSVVFGLLVQAGAPLAAAVAARAAGRAPGSAPSTACSSPASACRRWW